MKKILIPFNFSEPAVNALNYGIKIAEKFDAKIDLLCHVKDDEIYDISNNLEGQKLSFLASEKLKNIDENIQKILQRPDCHDLIASYEVKSGDEIKNIVEYEKENMMNLVIVGTPETNTADREKLVRLSICPVIVVPRFCSCDQGIMHIIYASNFDKNYPVIGNWLKLFAFTLKAKIHLLRINTPDNFLNSSQSKQRMLQFKNRSGLKKCTINTYDHIIVEEGIMEFTSTQNTDLLALVTHRRSEVSRWFNSSGTEKLVHKVNAVPIITFNAEIEEMRGYTIIPFPDQT
jgi:nucleotide-binding universal stress UspA family protein